MQFLQNFPGVGDRLCDMLVGFIFDDAGRPGPEDRVLREPALNMAAEKLIAGPGFGGGAESGEDNGDRFNGSLKKKSVKKSVFIGRGEDASPCISFYLCIAIYF